MNLRIARKICKAAYGYRIDDMNRLVRMRWNHRHFMECLRVCRRHDRRKKQGSCHVPTERDLERMGEAVGMIFFEWLARDILGDKIVDDALTQQ